MDTGLIVGILVLAGSVIASLVTYLVGVKKLSGHIKDSDAESLWTEVRALMQEYKDRNVQLTADLAACQAQVRELSKR